MKFVCLVSAILLFLNSANAEICAPTRRPTNNCEILKSTCSDDIAAYTSMYGEDAAKELYGTCPLNSANEVAASIANCSISALFITATLAKNIAIRSLMGVANTAFLVSTVHEAAKESEKCFLDVKGKLKVIDEYNAKIEFAKNKVPFPVTNHKINLPRKTIEEMTCVKLAQHLSYRNQLFEAELARNIKKVNAKDYDQIINFSLAEDQLTQNGVDVACIRPSKKALILCEIAAAGTGVGVFAASKLARQIAFAKALTKNPKRVLAKRKEARLGMYISESVNFSAKEISALKGKADVIFSSDLSEAQKIQSVSRLYFEARLSKLPKADQETARSILQNVGTDDHSYYVAQKIFIEKGLDPNLIDYQRVLGHEFEHAMQGLNDTNRKSLLESVKSLVGREKAVSPETYGDVRYRHEIEAIGAQYDIVQLFPKELVQAEASTIARWYVQRNSNGSAVVVQESDKLYAATTLSREQYIATIRDDHGYTGLWAAEQDLIRAKEITKSHVVPAAIFLPSLFAIESTGITESARAKIKEKFKPLSETEKKK